MGFEIHTQPTIFLGPVSALGGFYPPTGTGTLSGEYTAFFKTWTFIGDGATTRYSIFSDQLVLPYSENFIVNIDGVMQTPSKYTIDAVYKFIDFNEPIPLNSELTIVQIATLATPEAPPIKYATFYHNWQYTGNGGTNTYSIPTTGVLVPDSENYIVTLNGVVQPPTTYTIDTTNSLLTLDSTVPNGTQLSITQIGTLRKDTFSVYSYDFNTWSFSISSTVSTLPLSGAPVDLSPKQGAYLVSIDGVTQAPGVDFTVDVNAQTINFSSPLLSGSLVRVQQLGSLGIIVEDDIMSKYLSLSGGAINGNLLINGGLTALSGARFFTTNFSTTTALSVVNSGIGPALYVVQTNNQPVAILEGNTSLPILRVNQTGTGNAITVSGNISATGIIYTSNNNSNNWSNAYTTLQTNSANYILNGSNLSALNITLVNNGSIVGATSATIINIGALSARTLDLIHSPANDGVDPIFNIGETATTGFSGFRIRYEEPSNLLIGSSRTGTTILTSFMINVATGQVGISGMPAPGQALTVYGDISATGSLFASSSDFVLNRGNTLAVDLSVGTTNSRNLVLETDNTTRMFISSSGDVGIGTRIPTTTLDVFGSVELSGTSSSSGTLFASPPLIERTNIIFGRANDTTNIDVRTSNVWMFLSASTARWIHNIRGSSTTPLSDIMKQGDSLNLTLFSQQSSRSFFTSAIRIDNVDIAPRWFNNSVPVSSASLSGFDVYSWSIIKINDPSTYRVLGSVSQFG